MKKWLLVVLAAFFFLAALFVYVNRACLLIEYRGLPTSIRLVLEKQEITDVVFVYDLATRDDLNLHVLFKPLNGASSMFVFSPAFSEDDMGWLAERYALSGPLIRGEDDVLVYLKHLADCNHQVDWQGNFLVKLDRDLRPSAFIKL